MFNIGISIYRINNLPELTKLHIYSTYSTDFYCMILYPTMSKKPSGMLLSGIVTLQNIYSTYSYCTLLYPQ